MPKLNPGIASAAALRVSAACATINPGQVKAQRAGLWPSKPAVRTAPAAPASKARKPAKKRKTR